MPGSERGTPRRTDPEAWDLVQQNKGLMYAVLGKFMKTHWVRGLDYETLREELESITLLAFHHICTRWDESKSTLGTYVYKSLPRLLSREYHKMLMRGGTFKGVGPPMEIPRVDSLEGLFSNYLEGEDVDTYELLSQEVRPLWSYSNEDPYDTLIEEMDAEDFSYRVLNLIEALDEPQRSLLLLIHFSEPYASPDLKAHRIGAGLSIEEAAEVMGYSRRLATIAVKKGHEELRQILEEER